MKRYAVVLALFCNIAMAQTTTSITGTLKDLTNALITSGKVVFTLQPSRDTTISGLARFSPQSVTCLINGSGQITNLLGGTCSITMNTALQPPGTFYRVDVWPYSVKTSSFTFYAVLSSYDWSTVVPTPTTSPAQNFVDVFSNQTIGGTKTFSNVIATAGSFAGTLSGTFAGSETVTAINTVVYVDGSTYPFTAAGINSAMAAACNGAIPGKVVLSPIASTMSITAQLAPKSNCKLEGPGRSLLTLQASSSYSAGTLLPIASISNFTAQGFAIDGNRSQNANLFDLIHVDSSSNVTLNDLLVENGLNAGISLNVTDSNIVIRNSEIKNNGAVLPSATGGGIGISPGGAMSGIAIDHNYIHGNNHGIAVFNSNTTDALTGPSITNNVVDGNADDGILIQSSVVLGGTIRGAQISNNEAGCNGWPANGSGFPANCTADFLQNGSSSSTSGAGIDIIGPTISQPVISGNYLHDNFFDGVSIGTEMFATVTVAGANVTCTTCGVSAPNFNLGWKPNSFISVGGTPCQIASVGSATTLTLTTSCGANGQFIGPTYVAATIAGNNSYNNGNALSGGTGYFQQGADGNTWTGNVARHNNVAGFGCSLSNFTVYSGDVAVSNDIENLGQDNGGFTINNCAFTQIDAPVTLDPTTAPTQVNGVLNSGAFNTTIVGCPTGSSGALSDASVSVGTSFNNCGKPLGTSLNLTGQTANVTTGNTLYTTLSSLFGWGGAGLYRVCVSLWPTATGNSTVQGNAVTSIGGNSVVTALGSALNTAALTNGGGGCAPVHADAATAIKVSTSGYSTTGTYSIQATVEPAVLQ